MWFTEDKTIEMCMTNYCGAVRVFLLYIHRQTHTNTHILIRFQYEVVFFLHSVMTMIGGTCVHNRSEQIRTKEEF